MNNDKKYIHITLANGYTTLKKWPLIIALSVTSAHAYASETCEQMSSYRIDDSVTFNAVPLDKVLKQVVKSPFTVRISGLASHPVSIEGLSGPVDSVMGRIASAVSARVVQHGCEIEFVSAEAMTWTLPPKSSLRNVLGEWSKRSGWQVAWEITGSDVDLMTGAVFSGSYEDSIKQLMTSVEQQNPTIHHRLYAGNHVLRVWAGTPTQK